MAKAEIRWEQVSKTYSTGDKAVRAVQSTTATIKGGSFVSVVGPSGCGKSTLLLMTAGLLEPSSGVVTVGERVVHGPQSDIGIVFQRAALLEWRTALDNVLLQPEMRGLNKNDYRDRALELLNLVGLKDFEDRYPGELSGGMQQRTSVARALIMDLPVLLMDEPFGALDALTRDQLILDFQHLWWRTGPTVLFVTHSIAEAVFQSDQIIVVTPRPGKVMAQIDIDLPRPRKLAMRTASSYHRHIAELRDVFMDFGVLQEPSYSSSHAMADRLSESDAST